MRRRSTHSDLSVSYGAVGASRDPDIMRFPPEGATPSEDEVRLGSGSERFRIASASLMTWGAQRGAGATVTDVEDGTGTQYTGVVFDGDGQPMTVAEMQEQLFTAEGEAFLSAGQAATITWGEQARRVRVVYVVTEQRQFGFAIGTMDAEGVVGEERFVVQHRDDDSVWAMYRGFHELTTSLWKNPKQLGAIRVAQERATKQLRALLPVQSVLAGVQDGAEPAGELAAEATEPGHPRSIQPND